MDALLVNGLMMGAMGAFLCFFPDVLFPGINAVGRIPIRLWQFAIVALAGVSYELWRGRMPPSPARAAFCRGMAIYHACACSWFGVRAYGGL